MAPPTCRFDPQQMSVWSKRTNVRFLSDAERDEAFVRARPFLLEQVRILLENGWKQSDHKNLDEKVLFDIYKPKTATRGRQVRAGQSKAPNLILPNTFDSFLDTSMANKWRAMFKNPEIFKVENQNGKGNNVNRDLYISSARPLANIFYLLQVLAPGMLVMSGEYELHDAVVKVSRVLPRENWIKRNYRRLDIGSTDTLQVLLTAAKDPTIAFHEETTARPRYSPHATTSHETRPGLGYRHNLRNDSDFTPEMMSNRTQDWTACDKDCGWCGRCWDRLQGLTAFDFQY